MHTTKYNNPRSQIGVHPASLEELRKEKSNALANAMTYTVAKFSEMLRNAL